MPILSFFIFMFLSAFAGSAELESMTLEEKVGQLFMAYFDGEEINEHAERLIKEAKIGGIIYYTWANGLSSPDQIKQLSDSLQSIAKIPLFIATDQEGGVVTRLKEGFTEFPGNAALGQTGQPELAYDAAKAMGTEMRAVGINMNFAPVVDINSNPDNIIIGDRSYGSDPELVTRFGECSMRGYQDAGVIPCLKHFPGYGDVTIDAHDALPIVEKDLDELLNIELVPYATLANDAPMIMSTHVLFPALDNQNCATLSPTILKDLLRGMLGYDGILITDSLTMQGVLEGYENIDEVVIKAFEAGNDILLIGGRDLLIHTDAETNVDEVIRLYHHLLNAVRTGQISEERIDESVRRIMRLKSCLYTS